MPAPTNNYVIGRGKLYFDKFADLETMALTGERYLGNTPALSTTATYTDLDHYSSDFGTREKDDLIQLQVDRTGSFQCDNISMDNIALMFGADTSIETQAGITGEAEMLTVQQGLYYSLGADDAVPDGVGAVTNVVVTNNSGTHASGTVTFDANPTAADTVTVNGQAVTFVAGAPGDHEVQIGATTTVTAQAFAEEINAYPEIYKVTASGDATAILLTAIASGTGANAITLAKSGTHPTVSGATLSGGTASGIIVQSGNYEVDTARGRLHVLDDANSIANGDVIEVQYDVVTGSRALVVDAKDQVEGALRFVADNPKGTNKDYYWPRVRLAPNGDFALKGDAWQIITFNFEVVKKNDLQLVYIREAA